MEEPDSIRGKEFSFEKFNQSGIYKHQMSGTLLFNNGTAGMEPPPKEGILAAKNVQSVLTQEAVISPTFEKMNLHIAHILCPPGVSKLFI